MNSPSTGTKMMDGELAWLTASGDYYARRYPSYEEWIGIAYYALDKHRIKLARARCNTCQDVIESKKCGDFVSCSCGDSFVDTDRWFPERHRYGGSAICQV